MELTLCVDVDDSASLLFVPVAVVGAVDCAPLLPVAVGAELAPLFWLPLFLFAGRFGCREFPPGADPIRSWFLFCMSCRRPHRMVGWFC